MTLENTRYQTVQKLVRSYPEHTQCGWILRWNATYIARLQLEHVITAQ